MNARELLALYDELQRREAADPALRREVAGPVVRQISLHDRNSCVIYSRLDAQNIEPAIDAQIAYFRELGHGFEWKVYSHDQPADLKERLVRRGFELEETEAILALDLDHLPPSLESTRAPDRTDIRRIVDPAALRDLAIIRHAVWGEDTSGHQERLLRELREQSDRLRVYIAYADGAPAACGRLNLDPASPFASLWGGTTLPEFRHRGLYTALVGIRAREARAQGARFLTVDARPMSRPILEKLGFQLLTFANALHWRADADPG